MTIQPRTPHQSSPIYVRAWHFTQNFPKKLALGAQEAPRASGPAAAALLSATFSCFLLMVNQHFTSYFKTWNEWVWRFGDWIPGSRNADQLYVQNDLIFGSSLTRLFGTGLTICFGTFKQ